MNSVFGYLTVIDKYKKASYKCICICGKIVIRKQSELLKGTAKSCGCKNNNIKTEPGAVGLKRLFGVYRRGAEKRNLEFKLSLEQVKFLTKQSCYYCKAFPNKFISVDTKKNIGNRSIEAIKNAEYVYNGIDRKDNNIGYVFDNCLPCCYICNLMKRDMSHDDFLNHVGKINAL